MGGHSVQMRRGSVLVPWICGIIWLAGTARANFFDGDFVPTTRKAQYHGQRSNWHDVLGMHCPKFGEDRLVALPIPKPIDFENKDEYKIQLSFDSNRITTPWLRIIGNKAQDAPYLEIELIRSGDAVIGVSTKVNSLPKSDPKYREIEEEFRDPNKWPKHLLVQYSWQSKHEVDSGRGLSVILSVGLVWSLFVILTAWIKHRKQINKFLRDIDESQGSMAGSGLDAHKAE